MANGMWASNVPVTPLSIRLVCPVVSFAKPIQGAAQGITRYVHQLLEKYILPPRHLEF